MIQTRVRACVRVRLRSLELEDWSRLWSKSCRLPTRHAVGLVVRLLRMSACGYSANNNHDGRGCVIAAVSVDSLALSLLKVLETPTHNQGA